jgi:dTDP-4-dehydrorhamnose reductase
MILGSTGMLGSVITKVFSQSSHSIIEANRLGKAIDPMNKALIFDAERDEVGKLFNFKDDVDYVINCIGLIRQKIVINSHESIQSAINLNVKLPMRLAENAEKYNFKILQIATDCVFSGGKGSYTEADFKDPIDIYGYSKALGEIDSPQLLHLRTSIIGRELQSNASLIEWVLSHKPGSKIPGYTNHFWNGVTTLQLAKTFLGLVDNESFESGTFHFVPKNWISKYDLVQEIARAFGREDLIVEKFTAEVATNRTLETINKSRNLRFWKNSGYEEPLSVEEMLVEYVEWIKIQ